MTKIETFAADISQYASTAQVTTDPDALRNYAIDGLLPRIVVIPADVEQVAQIAALTSQHDLTLMARGGGSRTNLGAIPEQIDVSVSYTHLTLPTILRV